MPSMMIAVSPKTLSHSRVTPGSRRDRDLNGELSEFRSEADPHPFFVVRYAGHAQRRSGRLYHKEIREVRANAVLRIEQAGFDRKAHAGIEHGVITESEIGRLMTFHALAVRRTMIDPLLHALLHLKLMDGIRHVGAFGALARKVLLHQAAVAVHSPDLLHVRGARSNHERAVKLAATAPDA